MGEADSGVGGRLRGPEARSSERLLEAALRGDALAFTELYESHRRMLFGHCLAFCGSPEIAEDAVQDAYLRALHNLERFDPTRPLGPWLATIARRIAIDYLRHQRRHVNLPEEAAEGLLEERRAVTNGSQDVADTVVGRDLTRRLAEELQQVPRAQREVLSAWLRGRTYAEIAALTGSTVPGVKSCLFRLRVRLREACERAGLQVPGIVVWPLVGQLVAKVRGFVDRVRGWLLTQSPQVTSPAATSTVYSTLGPIIVGVGVSLGAALMDEPTEPSEPSARIPVSQLESWPPTMAPALTPDHPASRGQGDLVGEKTEEGEAAEGRVFSEDLEVPGDRELAVDAEVHEGGERGATVATEEREGGERSGGSRLHAHLDCEYWLVEPACDVEHDPVDVPTP